MICNLLRWIADNAPLLACPPYVKLKAGRIVGWAVLLLQEDKEAYSLQLGPTEEKYIYLFLFHLYFVIIMFWMLITVDFVITAQVPAVVLQSEGFQNFDLLIKEIVFCSCFMLILSYVYISCLSA